jgi:nitrogenase subunit NifH
MAQSEFDQGMDIFAAEEILAGKHGCEQMLREAARLGAAACGVRTAFLETIFLEAFEEQLNHKLIEQAAEVAA